MLNRKGSTEQSCQRMSERIENPYTLGLSDSD